MQKATYFTNVGPKHGPIIWRDDIGTIDVLEHPRDPQPVGTARPVGRTEGGIAIWQITIPGKVVHSRWHVLGRAFLLKR